MKPWIALSVLLVLAQGAKPRELFENGGFEQGTAGWRTLNQSGSCEFELDTKVKKEGKQSLRISRKAGDKPDFLKGFLDLPVREGSLAVALAYKLDKDSHVSSTVYFYDRDGKEVGKGFLAFFDESKPTKNFESVRKELEIPKNATGFGINVVLDKPGTVWIDEVSITAAVGKGGKPKPSKPSPAGTLENAGFEQGSDGWIEIRGGSGTLAIALDKQHKDSGAAALQLTRASPRLYPLDGVGQTLEDLGEARRWKLSAAALRSAGARASVLLVAYDSSGSPRESARAECAAAAGKDEFARTTLELVLAEPRERLRIELLIEGTGSVRFDSLVLEGRIILATLALCCSLGAADAKAALREAFTELLNERDARKRTELVARAVTASAGLGLDEALAVLREGPALKSDPRAAEQLGRFGSVVVGYLFEHEGERYRYAVDFPPSFELKKRVPLLLDPGHGTGAKQKDEGKAGLLEMFRRHANEAGGKDWLVVRTEILEEIGGDGKRGERPEDFTAAVFGALLRDLATRFPVDTDRVYVSGLSQTGFWSWYLGRERADSLAGIAPMSAVTWEVNQVLANFLALPVFALHGSADQICDVKQPRETIAALLRLGANVRYFEEPGAGHEYRVWASQPEALKWLASRPRERFPKRISRTLGTLQNPWTYWLCLGELEQQSDGKASSKPTAGIDGEIEGQTIRLFSQGVKRVRVALAPELVDLAAEVVVQWNGAQVFRGVPKPELATALALAGEKCDWRALFPCVLELALP